MHSNDRAVAALNDLIGRRVVFVFGGPSMGSVLDIHFGPTMRRETPLMNPDLSAEERELQGERSLFIECSWRFRRGDVLSGSGDPTSGPENTFVPVMALVGATLSKISLIEANGVLEPNLEFDDGATLRIFPCTCFEPKDNLNVFVEDESVSFYKSSH